MESPLERPRTSLRSMLLALALAAVLLVLAFRGADWGAMLSTLRGSRAELLALAFAILSGSYGLRALRWRILLSAERQIHPLTVFWATAAGYLGNSFLPARAGELIRSALIGRSSGASTSYVLATALTERMLDALALVVISLLALVALPTLPEWLVRGGRVMLVVSVVGIALLLIMPRIEGRLVRLVERAPAPAAWRPRLVAILRQFLLGMRAFQHPARGLGFVGLTAVIWLADALMAITVAQALGLQLALPAALLLLAALGLSSAAPSTPGYVGIYQFVAVTVLALFSYTREQALVYIIAFQAVTYAVVVLWGAIGLWRLGAVRRR